MIFDAQHLVDGVEAFILGPQGDTGQEGGCGEMDIHSSYHHFLDSGSRSLRSLARNDASGGYRFSVDSPFRRGWLASFTEADNHIKQISFLFSISSLTWISP
jgi:hypothetical protein